MHQTRPLRWAVNGDALIADAGTIMVQSWGGMYTDPPNTERRAFGWLIRHGYIEPPNTERRGLLDRITTTPKGRAAL